MSLWVDKHRPTSLNKLTLHPLITNKLLSIGNSDDLPHLLFYGPPGSGKKTRVMALLRELYGAGVERVKLEHRSFKTPSNKVVDITTLGSNFHIECNPSDTGNNDKFVTQEVIKEIASHGSLQTNTNSKRFRVVVLIEVDKLTKQAQASLRRTMEKYSAHCRLILICNSCSKIIAPLRSRCLGIRIPAPTNEELTNLLLTISNKEQLNCSPDLAASISLNSDRNIRRAILMLETVKTQNNLSVNDVQIILPDWELYIYRIAREILNEQSPSKLIQVREMVYELLINCIPPTIIIQMLTKELMKSLDDELKHELSYWAAYYEHRIQLGSKEIFHLEAFIAKFMAMYKKWIISIFG